MIDMHGTLRRGRCSRPLAAADQGLAEGTDRDPGRSNVDHVVDPWRRRRRPLPL